MNVSEKLQQDTPKTVQGGFSSGVGGRTGQTGRQSTQEQRYCTSVSLHCRVMPSNGVKAPVGSSTGKSIWKGDPRGSRSRPMKVTMSLQCLAPPPIRSMTYPLVAANLTSLHESKNPEPYCSETRKSSLVTTAFLSVEIPVSVTLRNVDWLGEQVKVQ